MEISASVQIVHNTVADNVIDGVKVTESNDIRIASNTFSRNSRHVEILEGGRDASDGSAQGHDPRHSDDPNVTWNVERVAVEHNVFDAVSETGTAFLSFDDTARAGSDPQTVTADFNTYRRHAPGIPEWVALWAVPAGGRVVGFATLEQLRAATGQEQHGEAS